MLSISEAKDIGRLNALQEVSDADMAELKARVMQRDSELKAMAVRREAILAHWATLREEIGKKLALRDPSGRVGPDDGDMAMLRRTQAVIQLYEEFWTLNEAVVEARRVAEEFRFHRTLLAPIRKLPAGILREIFIEACGGDAIPFEFGPRLPGSTVNGPAVRPRQLNPTSGSTTMRISRTCKHWRDIALATPELWTCVTIRVVANAGDPDVWAEGYLEAMAVALEAIAPRAQPLQVDLRIASTDGLYRMSEETKGRWSRGVRAFFKLNPCHRPRIQTPPRLDLSMSFHQFPLLDTHCVESLREASMTEIRTTAAHAIRCFPKLRKLTFAHVSDVGGWPTMIRGPLPTPSQTLTELVLSRVRGSPERSAYSTIGYALSALVPRLTTLRWRERRGGAMAPLFEANPHITFRLPCLTTLELQLEEGSVHGAVAALLTTLQLPALTRLDIILPDSSEDSSHPENARLSDDIAEIHAALASGRYVPSLETLRVAIAPQSIYYERESSDSPALASVAVCRPVLNWSFGIAAKSLESFARLAETVAAALSRDCQSFDDGKTSSPPPDGSTVTLPDSCAMFLAKCGLKRGANQIHQHDNTRRTGYRGGLGEASFVENLFDELWADSEAGDGIGGAEAASPQPAGSSLVIRDMKVLGRVAELMMDEAVPGRRRSFALVLDAPLCS